VIYRGADAAELNIQMCLGKPAIRAGALQSGARVGKLDKRMDRDARHRPFMWLGAEGFCFRNVQRRHIDKSLAV
jgi:hypothetical protein